MEEAAPEPLNEQEAAAAAAAEQSGKDSEGGPGAAGANEGATVPTASDEA